MRHIMNKLKTFLSRKLLVAVLSSIFLGVNSQLANPLDPEAVHNIVTVIVSYLLGQAAVDAVAAARGGK